MVLRVSSEEYDKLAQRKKKKLMLGRRAFLSFGYLVDCQCREVQQAFINTYQEPLQDCLNLTIFFIFFLRNKAMKLNKFSTAQLHT